MLGLSIELDQAPITKFLLSKFHDPRNALDLEVRNPVIANENDRVMWFIVIQREENLC